ncbi:sugar ABC transporter periplasmic protein [Ameyamaea chiangmaiensis NBRC 103196]|uniref:ABC transporter substrate-binding protein n=1 Tax=Ameyamaea chiangmaiensis TaxID=442969 RepID=A0A850PET2_9PROT|nr:ABC transporter substrate-binding protein [Ameyamaea chiangmaiensis]MBS4075279.1 ABC transporter substrate-binding protein [Ameyamaea chiangmaiensis]NVN41363.1 ABC transporter substrate-binding protein [Ameyamaea chiangmaiensis]GBQ66637.1 sugar ABC transporter periplasmic protein [Ameyamaea chiangmaiensis NBRC 103196]
MRTLLASACAALLCGTASLALALAPSASAAPITSIGVTMGSLGNPYFVTLSKAVADEARKADPSARVTSVSADYDLNKQFTQIDNFIASGVKAIIINAVDPKAILPAIKRAQAAGIVVIAADVAAAGADATVMTDNVKAGEISCAFLADQIGHKGEIAIENGPSVSSVIDRVAGCKKALAASPDIKIVSDDQNGQGSRDAGMQVMLGYLIRYPDLKGVFTINDPQAIGSDLAARQQNRQLVITSVDGAPDIVGALKSKKGSILASASQDPYKMGTLAMQTAQAIVDGKPPAEKVVLIAPQLITRDNVGSYVGWTDH